MFLLALSSVVQGNWAFIEFVENSAVYFDGSMRKYEYIAQAMNFQAEKGSIDMSSKAETLRVRLRRAGLCDVTAGPDVEPIVRKLPPPL